MHRPLNPPLRFEFSELYTVRVRIWPNVRSFWPILTIHLQPKPPYNNVYNTLCPSCSIITDRELAVSVADLVALSWKMADTQATPVQEEAPERI